MDPHEPTLIADTVAPVLGQTTDEKIEIWRYWANEEWLWAWACEHGTHMYGYASHQVLLADLGHHFATHFEGPDGGSDG
jgi:hypothetical protein